MGLEGRKLCLTQNKTKAFKWLNLSFWEKINNYIHYSLEEHSRKQDSDKVRIPFYRATFLFKTHSVFAVALEVAKARMNASAREEMGKRGVRMVLSGGAPRWRWGWNGGGVCFVGEEKWEGKWRRTTQRGDWKACVLASLLATWVLPSPISCLSYFMPQLLC